MRWRNVLCGRRRAFAEEELLHLFHDYFLILLAGRIQTVFVEQHLAVLCPLAPGLLGNLVVNLLTQFRIERRLFQPRQFLFQFGAENFVS